MAISDKKGHILSIEARMKCFWYFRLSSAQRSYLEGMDGDEDFDKFQTAHDTIIKVHYDRGMEGEDLHTSQQHDHTETKQEPLRGRSPTSRSIETIPNTTEPKGLPQNASGVARTVSPTPKIAGKPTTAAARKAAQEKKA